MNAIGPSLSIRHEMLVPAKEGIMAERVPGIGPRPINYNDYVWGTPEKIEMFGGYLLMPEDEPESRERLLLLLMINAGLSRVLRFAPREAWQEALRLDKRS